MIYIVGDTHIPIDIHKLSNDDFPGQKDMNKNDYVIICGDFGGVWNNSSEELYWRNWLKDRNFSTLFIDGNHENFDLLGRYPVSLWNGGKVHFINDSIIHLMRGQVFNINGLKFFTMGGARSVDKINRREHISWWQEEIPTRAEFEEGFANLEKHNYEVDYVITHTCAEDTINSLWNMFGYRFKLDTVSKYLGEIKQKTKYKHWYFGHFHKDVCIDDRHTLLYKEMVKITNKQ